MTNERWRLLEREHEGRLFIIEARGVRKGREVHADVTEVNEIFPEFSITHPAVRILDAAIAKTLRPHARKKPVLARLGVVGGEWRLLDADEASVELARAALRADPILAHAETRGAWGRRKKKRERISWEQSFKALDLKIRSRPSLSSRDAAAVERADAERRRIAHLMHAAPGASASHRGTKSTYNTAARDAVRREPDAPRERITDGKRHPVKVARVSDSGRMRP
jgi:hypothetical protein